MFNSTMTDTNIQPELIPGIHWDEVYETSKMIAEIYGVDIRTVQLWDQKGWIKRDARGIYHFRTAIQGIYDAQLAIINKKKGPEDEESNGLEIREQRAKTEKAEIELAKLKGELVSADDVKSSAFEKARQIRNAFENIPSRLSAILAAETDPHKIKLALDKEIKQTLEVLTA